MTTMTRTPSRTFHRDPLARVSARMDALLIRLNASQPRSPLVYALTVYRRALFEIARGEPLLQQELIFAAGNASGHLFTLVDQAVSPITLPRFAPHLLLDERFTAICDYAAWLMEQTALLAPLQISQIRMLVIIWTWMDVSLIIKPHVWASCLDLMAWQLSAFETPAGVEEVWA
jgi:hypothetical protein